MNRHPGFSKIADSAEKQMLALNDAVATGRITKLLVEDEAVYFRRAPGCEGDDYALPEPDYQGAIESLAARIDVFEKEFIVHLAKYAETSQTVERRLDVSRGGIQQISDRLVDNAVQFGTVNELLKAGFSRQRMQFNILWFAMMLLTGSFAGGIIAFLTR